MSRFLTEIGIDPDRLDVRTFEDAQSLVIAFEAMTTKQRQDFADMLGTTVRRRASVLLCYDGSHEWQPVTVEAVRDPRSAGIVYCTDDSKIRCPACLDKLDYRQ